MYSRSPQNLEFGQFTLLFYTGGQRNVQKFKTHMQSNKLFFFIKPVLRHCRCRHHRHCISSLMIKPHYLQNLQQVPHNTQHYSSRWTRQVQQKTPQWKKSAGRNLNRHQLLPHASLCLSSSSRYKCYRDIHNNCFCNEESCQIQPQRCNRR